MQKIGIFGGTFDPIHNGHLAIAEAALKLGNLDQVIWVPVNQAHHKSFQTSASIEQRRQMLEIAISNYPKFTLILPELTSFYAIDTKIKLEQTYPNKHWSWILGLDTFLTLPKWYQCQQLCETVDWIIAPRSLSDFKLTEINNSPEELCKEVARQLWKKGKIVRWQILNSPQIDISSTIIRQRCFLNQTIDGLVPKEIITYIKNQKIYLIETLYK
ncbi:MAG TPA: nicotinate (nicotinamide) nucleotide adenylyltransferase [Halomicronema sp.]